MNLTHVHLLITHLPIFGSILGGIVLAHGLWAKSNPTKMAAYILFIISSIGAGISYLTGEAAEEAVERIQGVAEGMIEQHEDFALISLIALIILGFSSIVGAFFILKQSSLVRNVAWVTLFISLISFGLIARTGYLGGLIRHTEVNPSNITTIQDGEVEEGENEDEDD